nr:hypothetical protein [Comamonas testosteroni]
MRKFAAAQHFNISQCKIKFLPSEKLADLCSAGKTTAKWISPPALQSTAAESGQTASSSLPKPIARRLWLPAQDLPGQFCCDAQKQQDNRLRTAQAMRKSETGPAASCKAQTPALFNALPICRYALRSSQLHCPDLP